MCIHIYIAHLYVYIYVRVARLCACIECSDQAGKQASREREKKKRMSRVNEWNWWTEERSFGRMKIEQEIPIRMEKNLPIFWPIPTRLFASFKHAVCMFNLDEWLLSAPETMVCVHVWPSFKILLSIYTHTHTIHRSSTWKFKLKMPLWNAPAAFPAHFVETKTSKREEKIAGTRLNMSFSILTYKIQWEKKAKQSNTRSTTIPARTH